MLCSSPDDALSVLWSGVLQMAMAILLSIAFSNQIERLKWLVCILLIFLISHSISISVGRGVASGQGWNILVGTHTHTTLLFWGCGKCPYFEYLWCYHHILVIDPGQIAVDGDCSFCGDQSEASIQVTWPVSNQNPVFVTFCGTVNNSSNRHKVLRHDT